MLYLGGILVVIHIVSTLRADLYVEVRVLVTFGGVRFGESGEVFRNSFSSEKRGGVALVRCKILEPFGGGHLLHLLYVTFLCF